MSRRQAVADLHDLGFKPVDIADIVGLQKSTVYDHLRSQGKVLFRLHYNWTDVQAFYDQGNSMRACRNHFGMTLAALCRAVKSGRLVTRKKKGP